MLKGKNIGLFITGGIASYKMAEFARQLIKSGANVRVAMTEAAQEFITPLTFQTLTKHHVLVDTFDEHDPATVQHIHMADWIDMAIIVPATANIISKIANGIGDDIVSSTLLAVHSPRLVVPAMNTNMWANPAVERNVAQLRGDGYTVMEPDTGFLAEGYEGKGRLPELNSILEMANTVMALNRLPQHLKGKKVIVTSGGTIERIDPVRYITNDSSGKMGFALAKTAAWLGAEVELITTKPDLGCPYGVNITAVTSAKEMQEAINEHYFETDYVVMAAAVSDYRVANAADQKIKSGESGNDTLTLELVENPDILKGLGDNKSHQTLIGFAAESQNVIEYAEGKLEDKNLDWIVANDISQPDAGFNVDTNQVTVLGSDGTKEAFPNMTKQDTALRIWETIFS